MSDQQPGKADQPADPPLVAVTFAPGFEPHAHELVVGDHHTEVEIERRTSTGHWSIVGLHGSYDRLDDLVAFLIKRGAAL